VTRPAAATADWLFRSREDGRTTLAQRPNLPLALWMGATALRWLLHPDGRWRTALDVVAAAALLVWAVDEVVRGVNPFRRMLGGGVLLALTSSWWVRS
jgi:hypothetical protein